MTTTKLLTNRSIIDIDIDSSFIFDSKNHKLKIARASF